MKVFQFIKDILNSLGVLTLVINAWTSWKSLDSSWGDKNTFMMISKKFSYDSHIHGHFIEYICSTSI
jgi:hypothetical protein